MKETQFQNPLKPYKEVVSCIIAGTEKKYEVAANNHNSDGDPKGGIKEIVGEPEFDPENNELKYSVVGPNGGDYLLYVDFDDKKVYHAHVNKPEQKGEVSIIKFK